MEVVTSSSPPSFFRRAILPRLVFALLLFSVLWVYLPARYRYFAKDQLAYLAELDGDRSLSGGLRLLDYATAREYNKGDELLYRPLLFTGLAIQNAVLGLDYRAWNLANLAVHLLTVWVLFECLWRLRRSAFAHAFALWFALLAANFELVTWNHLGGYMLGYALLLVAWLALHEARLAGRPQAWILYGMAITAAMLIHEIAVAAALLAPFLSIPFLRRHSGKPRQIALMALLAPLALFALLYAFHLARCERWLWVDAGGQTPRSVGAFLWQMLSAFGVWTTRILLPATLEYTLRPFDRSLWQTPSPVFTRPAFWVQLGCWLGIAVILKPCFSRKQGKARVPFAGSLALLLLAYIAMNTWGRPYVLQVAYYPYFFALLGIVLVYALLDFSSLGPRARTSALVLCLVLCGFNGAHLRQTARRIPAAHAPIIAYLDTIDRTVQPHLQDPGFTFGIRNLPRERNILIPLCPGYSQEHPDWLVPLLKILYGPCYDSFMPRTWLVLEPE